MPRPYLEGHGSTAARIPPSTVIRPFLPLRFLGRLLATVMSRSSSSYGRMTDLRCEATEKGSLLAYSMHAILEKLRRELGKLSKKGPLLATCRLKKVVRPSNHEIWSCNHIGDD